jgi:RNA polymerase sigma-70 factor (ECF subfamily)
MPRKFTDWREIPSDVLARKEIRAALQSALDSLPDQYRLVFVLRDMQHLSVEETATVLGITAEAVKTRSHRARLHANARATDGCFREALERSAAVLER